MNYYYTVQVEKTINNLTYEEVAKYLKEYEGDNYVYIKECKPQLDEFGDPTDKYFITYQSSITNIYNEEQLLDDTKWCYDNVKGF